MQQLLLHLPTVVTNLTAACRLGVLAAYGLSALIALLVRYGTTPSRT